MMFQTGSSSAVLSAAILFLLGGQLNVVNSFYIPGLNPQNFKEGDDVPLKVNKLSSPETLLPVDYYRLPFCQPTGGPKRSHENLGELLMGDRIETSPYTLQMKTDMYCNQVCVSNLGRAETEGASLNKVARAIRNNYHANWLVDNLPSGSKFEDDANEYTKFSQGFPIGFVATDTHLAYVNNHVNLQIFYHPVELEENKYRVVEFLVEPMSIKHDIGLANDDDNDGKEGDNDAKATYEINNPIPSCNPKTNNIHTTFEMITAKGREAQPASGRVLFTYDVIWTQSSIKWASRWDNYLKMEYGSKIHWLSILNSLTIVLILSAVLAAVLVKNLRRDYQRYNRLPTDEERLDDVEEFGWKLVHADVFRPPSRPMLMSIILGTGTQLLSMTLITIFFAALGFLSPANRGGLLTALLVTYVLLGSVSGYVCARMYKTFKGKSWQQATTFNAFAFPTLTFGLFFIMDVVAMAYGSSDAVPFTTILLLLVLWLGISTPLVYFGAYFGFKQDAIEFPVNTSNIPRQIPDQPWFSNSFFVFILGGMIPFGSVFLELYFILSSVWMEKAYYVFGALLIVFLLLLLLCAEISILWTYIQLCSEDYLWWWRSFLSSGSIALYVFVYSCMYFKQIKHTSSFATYALYFGHMGLASMILFLAMGSFGVMASLWFNKTIFGSIKTD